MPWVRFNPAGFGTNTLAVSRQLVEDGSDFWHNYVLLRSTEWHALLSHPADGLSAYQLVLLAEEKSIKSRIERAFLEMFWGSKDAGWKIKLLILGPLLGLLGAFFLSQNKPNRKLLLATVAAQVLFYGFIRWTLNATYLDRLVAQLDFNWGIWLCLYGTAAMALLILLRLVMPEKYKW